MTSDLVSKEFGLEHGFAQVGGVRLHYVRRGHGPNLILLLHGFPQCWYSWRHQLNVFGPEFSVVAPDMRGYGESDKPSDVASYQISKLVDDVTGLIRHLGYSRASVVGHDWGAGVAWAVALGAPEYVNKLVTMQVPPLPVWKRNMSFGQLCRSWYMLLFQIPRLPEWLTRRNNFEGLRRMFKTTTIRPGVFSDDDIEQFVSAVRQPAALTGAINYYRANFRRMAFRDRDADALARRKVKVPTMFIFAEKDFAILPQTARGVSDFIDSEFSEVRFANCGHWVHEELPAEVNAKLLEFLA